MIKLKHMLLGGHVAGGVAITEKQTTVTCNNCNRFHDELKGIKKDQ